MWKSLTSTQKVNSGDKIRYLYPNMQNAESFYQVIKTDEHYFEVLPAIADADPVKNLFSKRIVRYFDLGYNIQIEVWQEGI